MTHLSDTERRILINQMHILASLNPSDAAQYEKSISRLSGTDNEDILVAQLKEISKAQTDDAMGFTLLILSFYDDLQNSFYALDLKEKIQLDNSALIFPGFHCEYEEKYCDYVSFIVKHLGQFQLLERHSKDSAPDYPMLPFYRKLMELRPNSNCAMLSFVEISEMISKINDLDRANRHDADRMDAASAA